MKKWSSSSRTLTLQSLAVNRDHFSFSICSDTIVLNILFPWRERESECGGEKERDTIFLFQVNAVFLIKMKLNLCSLDSFIF